MSRKARRIWICVAFNMAYEFAFRGVAGFAMVPLLFPLLLIFYFSYYSFVNYLIRRYYLHNYEIFAVINLIGIPLSVSFSGFRQELMIGTFIIQDFSWAYVLQGILTFYLANRLLPRDWAEPLMSAPGISAALLGILVTMVAFANATNALQRSYAPVSIVLGIAYWIFWLVFLITSIRMVGRQPWEFRRSKLLDVVSISTPIVCTIIGLLPLNVEYVGASLVRPQAIQTFLIWTGIFTFCYLYYRITARREVPI
jgi:hypothetical protein